MKSAVRRMGNSAGIIIPKPVLTEIGARAGDAVDVSAVDGRIIIAPIRNPRAGWAEAAQRIAEAGEDEPIWPEFGNDGDDELVW